MEENEKQTTDNHVPALYPWPYLTKNGCLYIERTNKQGKYDQKLCNFLPRLVCEITLDDGATETKRLLLEGQHAGGYGLRQIEIAGSELASFNWLIENWGVDCNLETGSGVRECVRYAIQSTAPQAERKTIYAVTGWKKVDGKWIYLMPGDENITVTLKGKLARYEMKPECQPADLATAAYLLDAGIAPKEIIYPLLAFTFLTPLGEFLHQADCQPKFVLLMLGKTGTRKSTLAALFLSFFGHFTASDLPLSFQDTKNSIIQNAFSLKDVLTCIDDFHPCDRQDEIRLTATIQAIMRAYGDRTGRGRLRSDSTLMESKPPQGNAIVTAEFAPDIGESGTARYFSLELKEGDVDLEMLSLFQPEAVKGALRNSMDYCCRDDKVFDADGNRYISGVNCDGENAFVEFMTTKNAFVKTDGMNFYQYVQSFSPEENITPKQAHEIATAFAKQAWQGHEILVDTHCDAGHIHSHFVINSVSFETGYKLRQHPNTLKALRDLSDHICKESGFSVLDPYKNDGTKLGTREYRSADKGASWKFQLMVTIDSAMNKSGNRREFIEEMRRHGYEILWTDTRKYITFTCPNGMKCREIRLHDKKYCKENIENELRIRQEILGGQAQAEQSGGTFGDGKRTVPPGGLRSDGETAGDIEDTARTGGGVSAGDLREDFGAGDTGGDGAVLHRNAEDDNSVGGGYAPQSGGQERRSTAENEPSARTDAGEYRTGWEESRRIYFGNVGGHGRKDNSTQVSDIRSAPENYSDFVRHGGGIGTALTRGLSSASRIIDDTAEDPEERRRRIEAEHNGSDLGAILGLAIGAAAELMQKNDPSDDEPEEENEPTMNL